MGGMVVAQSQSVNDAGGDVLAAACNSRRVIPRRPSTPAHDADPRRTLPAEPDTPGPIDEIRADQLAQVGRPSRCRVRATAGGG